MTTINLYQAGKLNAYIPFPTNWSELTTAEIIAVCKQMLVNGESRAVAKAAILQTIIEHRARAQKTKLPVNWIDLLDAEQTVMDGFQLVDFIWNDNTLVKAPEPVIRLSDWKKTRVYGPAPEFEDMTCGEFEDAEIFFHQFNDNPNPESLAQLAAVLWRPRRFFKRRSYTGYNSALLVKHFLKLEPWRLYAVFVWYMGCRRRLPKLFKKVYEGNGGTPGPPDMLAFTKCIHAAAGPRNGLRSHIRTLKLMELLFDMEQEAIKAAEIQAHYEQLRNQQ